METIPAELRVMRRGEINTQTKNCQGGRDQERVNQCVSIAPDQLQVYVWHPLTSTLISGRAIGPRENSQPRHEVETGEDQLSRLTAWPTRIDSASSSRR